MFGALRKFWHLDWPDRLLLAESVGSLALASLAIAFLPFRTVARIASAPTRTPPPDDQARTTLDRIRWSIMAASARVPWRTVCFQEGLAAHWMLWRRGMPSILYYGAALSTDAELATHVWVRSGAFDMVGCETASDYAVLATFPTTDALRAKSARA